MQIEKLSPMHLDVLKEIGNIGAGNAATSLSKLTNQYIDMNVPAVKIIAFDEIDELLGGEEQVVVTIFFRVLGEATGSMFFMLPVDQASKLVKQVTGSSPISDDFSEIEESTLKEIGNILAGAYLSSLSDFTKFNLQPTIPSLNIDMASSVISFGLLEISQVSDHAIVIETSFVEKELNEQIKGYFLFLPDPGSFEKIFSALGVPVNDD